jgi:threonine/homoserine/homoserine lactone efflux protein
LAGVCQRRAQRGIGHPDQALIGRIQLESSVSAARTLSRVFGQGIIVNILNPKTTLFFFAFLPQFVNPSRGPVAAQILFLGLLFAAMGVVSDSLWGFFRWEDPRLPVKSAP